MNLTTAPAHFQSFRDVAFWLVSTFPLPSPIVPCIIVTDLGLENNTPIVALAVGDTTYNNAYFLAPIAIQVGKLGWATRMPDGRWACIATNYRNSP